MNTDQGTRFGTWPDTTSRLLYHDLTPAHLSGLPLDGRVVDLGGGNGLLREYVPQAVTVDSDPTKEPDVVADITTWHPLDRVDLAVCRYVTHYLTDDQLDTMLATVARYSPLLCLTAITTNPAIKDANPDPAPRYWRDRLTLRDAIAPAWRVRTWRGFDVEVGADFYRNRLGVEHPGHREHLTTYHLEAR